MDRPIVACIQHRVFLPKTTDEYDAHLHRFLRMAKAKGAVLALFPELSGVATAFPLLRGWRNMLLKEADQARRGKGGWWQQVKSKLAGSAAVVVKADLRTSFLRALHDMPESLYDAYYDGFSNLARQYEMTIVAGSLYQLDPDDGVMRNISLVFGPDGSLLGRQAKVVLSERDQEVSQAADGWGVIPTPAGRVGILLGNDVLYPEPARILAYQGADMLLTMGAVTRPATFHKIRQAALARCQENQLYGMVSFLVGPDPFAPADAPPFVGKSAIFAPLEFTPRFTGVMVEVGSPLAEAVITAEWDYPALEELWRESDTPLRREMPLLQAGPILAQVYARALPLTEAGSFMLESPEQEEAAPPQPEEAAAAQEMEREPEAPVPEESAQELMPEIEVPVPEEETPAEEAEEAPFPPIMPILPESIYAPSSDELEDAAEVLSAQVHMQSQMVEVATSEVRDEIQRASERVRAAASETPDEIEDTIAAVVEETTSALAGKSEEKASDTEMTQEKTPVEAAEEAAPEESATEVEVVREAEMVEPEITEHAPAEEAGEGESVAEQERATAVSGKQEAPAPQPVQMAPPDTEESEQAAVQEMGEEVAAEERPPEEDDDDEGENESGSSGGGGAPPKGLRWPWQR